MVLRMPARWYTARTPGPCPCPPALAGDDQAGIGFGQSDLDIGEMLVVLELDIVPGGVLAHQVGLQDEGLHLVVGDDPLQVAATDRSRIEARWLAWDRALK